MDAPIPLAYTFGNHMHWVDMEWLWGYDVLPGSTDDMLAYCRQAGIRGNVNFDGIGYEKMASESPEHLSKLREAVSQGVIEVVGGSYGQPYGLFHGGESNIRQRIYGVRTAIRTLGTRPRTFWEEEFDFFPQLPQMLAGCGFTGAALYFQWTWHTPEIPREEAPVVAWQGLDGTQIPSATRNRLNLHQWPEDFRLLLDDLAANPPQQDADGPPPLVLQWLELMPTQDWMCRSELMAPMLAELRKDPRFAVEPTTLGEYLARWKGQDLPPRTYGMDEVWHGMTLGKNGDNHPKKSAYLERRLLEAETAAAILGLFGRPYEPWDVYPTWELEEGWRNLLAAQHHDNHECEGLCGHVAEAQFAFVDTLLSRSDAVDRLADRVGVSEGEAFVFNGLGIAFKGTQFGEVEVPPMGYRRFEPEPRAWPWTIGDGAARFESEGLLVEIDLETATILTLRSALGESRNLAFGLEVGGASAPVESYSIDDSDGCLSLYFGPDSMACLNFRAVPETGELEIWASVEPDFELDPGYAGAVQLVWGLGGDLEVQADGPYSVQTVGGGSKGQRKYPEGDWMTSPQWFESVEGAFTSHSFVQAVGTESGILICHSGSQQWFRDPGGLRTVLLANDPWDGGKQVLDSKTAFRLAPSQGLPSSECWRRASALRGRHPEVSHEPVSYRSPSTSAGPMPKDFCAVQVHSGHVLATAFYREQATFCAKGLDGYAGKDMGHPYILRLVEFDGWSGQIEVTVAGPIARAVQTNLMGEALRDLSVQPADTGLLSSEPARLAAYGIEAVAIRLDVKPYEIVTVVLDIVPGRKQFRDLDAKREIWATVHRIDG